MATTSTDAPAADIPVPDESWRQHLRELLQYRYLLRNLVERDLKVRYKNSLLGVLWSLLNPLLIMVVFWLVFSKFLSDNIREYHIFILVGLLPWNFFSASVISGTNAIMQNTTLVKKVYFPRELLPVAAVLSNLVNFSLAFIVLLVFLYIAGLGLTVHALWVPVLLLTQIIFVLGLVLGLSAAHVFYRDIAMILDVVMLGWFFLTPVVYSLDRFGSSTTILGVTFDPAVFMRWVNPMASLIDGYRTVLWGSLQSNGPVSMDPAYLARTFVTAVIVCAAGYWFFQRTQHLFGEKL